MSAVATSIDEVIAQLGDLIDRSLRERSRLGFFAALYRKVTVKVKEGIAAGRFDDGRRMERLDVTFANRYLEAVARLRTGQDLAGGGAAGAGPARSVGSRAGGARP